MVIIEVGGLLEGIVVTCENSHVHTTNTFSTVYVVTFLTQATEIMKDAQQNLLLFEKDKSCLLLEF